MGQQWASPAFNFPGQLLPFQLTSQCLSCSLKLHKLLGELYPGALYMTNAAGCNLDRGPQAATTAPGGGADQAGALERRTCLGGRARTLLSTLGPLRAGGLLNGCSALT